MTHSTEETTYTASDLEPSTSVFVRVAATSDAGMSGYTTHATGMSATPPPPPPAVSPDAPTGLSVSAVTDTSATWSWDAVDGADGYQVQFNTAESFDGVDAMNTAETWHTQTGLSAGMAGYLRVRSTSGSGDAMLASAWTAHLTATTRMRPGIPMNLSAAAGEGSITWTWDAVDNADSYYVQHSADGAFTAGGESMEVMETSYTKSDLETGATAYLRVRSSDGTGDQERLMSGWSSPTRGMSATPTIPVAPTGLNATGGDGSISWSWNAVEGAMGYQVQVSMSEDFSAAETMDVEETSYSADVDAGSTRYLRVRATGMGDPSGWSTHVTGMSDAAVVTVVEPDPVTVTFSFPEDPKSSYYLIPVDGPDDTNKEKATASVNSQITVTSNATAEIMPMFMPDANPVRVAEGDSWPFAFVDWTALQEDVVSEAGVVFKIMRVTVGANQQMEPTGDVAYVTCGPFRCTESSDMMAMAPAITIDDSATCSAFATVDFMPHAGRVDNTPIGSRPLLHGRSITENATSANPNTGIDFGWSYISDAGFTAEHSLAIVSEKSGAVKKTSTKKNLMVPNVGDRDPRIGALPTTASLATAKSSLPPVTPTMVLQGTWRSLVAPIASASWPSRTRTTMTTTR